MDLQHAVVVDEPELAEFVHEAAYTWTCAADHFRERLLAHRYDRLRLSLLAEVRHQEEYPRQTLLA